MLTCTTYGSWLRGDKRGWVDDGKILPADAQLEVRDRQRMKHSAWVFNDVQQIVAGVCICKSLRERMNVGVWALAIESWHVHVVLDWGDMHAVGRVVKCMKDAVRYGLKNVGGHAGDHVGGGRPIWTTGYDKRWCFDAVTLRHRVAYVQRHNLQRGFTAHRFDGVTPCPHLAPGQ